MPLTLSRHTPAIPADVFVVNPPLPPPRLRFPPPLPPPPRLRFPPPLPPPLRLRVSPPLRRTQLRSPSQSLPDCLHPLSLCPPPQPPVPAQDKALRAAEGCAKPLLSFDFPYSLLPGNTDFPPDTTVFPYPRHLLPGNTDFPPGTTDFPYPGPWRAGLSPRPAFSLPQKRRECHSHAPSLTESPPYLFQDFHCQNLMGERPPSARHPHRLFRSPHCQPHNSPLTQSPASILVLLPLPHLLREFHCQNLVGRGSCPPFPSVPAPPLHVWGLRCHPHAPPLPQSPPFFLSQLGLGQLSPWRYLCPWRPPP